MKYNAKQLTKQSSNSGKWAVFTGKQYFVDTLCDTKNEAVIQACEYSARWYQEQMDNCRELWEDTHRDSGKVDIFNDNATRETGIDFDSEWGNILC